MAAMSDRISPTSSFGQPAAAAGSSTTTSMFQSTAVVAAAVKLAGRRSSTGGEHVNIKVAVRVRPLGEDLEGEGTLLLDGATQLSLVQPQGGQRSDFSFDHVYGPKATQAELYDDLGRQILDCAFEGYNGTIFAYGQTGSGKTHTIMGTTSDRGIIPRLGADLFERVEQAGESCAFVVTATYLELYNEVVCDLLSPGSQGLKIRQHLKTGIYVEDLTEVQLSNQSELERLITEGNKSRQVAATRMNERSSRSHAIFTLQLRQQRVEPEVNGEGRYPAEAARLGGTLLTSKINLVDLAGSERADMSADSRQLHEGAAINKSLSALGNVINALTEGAHGKTNPRPQPQPQPHPHPQPHPQPDPHRHSLSHPNPNLHHNLVRPRCRARALSFLQANQVSSGRSRVASTLVLVLVVVVEQLVPPYTPRPYLLGCWRRAWGGTR
jgi:hypothetical protein